MSWKTYRIFPSNNYLAFLRKGQIPRNSEFYMEQSDNKKFNPRGGRPKKSPDQVLEHRLQFYVTPDQLKEVEDGFAQSGCRTMSAYLSKQYFSRQTKASVNPVRILDAIDTIGTELGRIGRNINQIARYANSCSSQQKADPQILYQFNEQMDRYAQSSRSLLLAYRKLIRVLK